VVAHTPGKLVLPIGIILYIGHVADVVTIYVNLNIIGDIKVWYNVRALLPPDFSVSIT